jgi:hypothetical protein
VKRPSDLNQVPRSRAGWGELTGALDALVQEGLILSYSAAAGTSTAASVEVAVPDGADEAEVVRRVSQSLPGAFSQAEVRTRTA